MPSTVIAHIGYDAETKKLTIVYVSGHTYVYHSVPETVYKDLKASRVKGRYLRFFVKDKYLFEKIASPVPIDTSPAT
ncbi:KTSC domain-containing protein [Mucilaginibacter sp. 14171R-50]|uniref:KTSC domain-containing protein n=1 Tax=Mucilaginibacter sp. 14171R-50 TaxID=2703789 RepID=UPI00138C764A|nr:KTSC domain-containing protein [Mucilaginibacter sp. 14171R-50]QHS56880.1 KTSC domain-containing protein [Mucilaginibacter sp. 14171R-50]